MRFELDWAWVVGGGLIVGLAAGCAAPGAYMGVSLTPGGADPHIQSLAHCAMAGDSARAGCPGGASAQKAAQLALGIAYEEGKGVAQDLKKARKLYRAAATPSGGTIYVYVPATRKGGKGYVTPVNTGPRVEGLAEADAFPILFHGGDLNQQQGPQAYFLPHISNLQPPPRYLVSEPRRIKEHLDDGLQQARHHFFSKYARNAHYLAPMRTLASDAIRPQISAEPIHQKPSSSIDCRRLQSNIKRNLSFIKKMKLNNNFTLLDLFDKNQIEYILDFYRKPKSKIVIKYLKNFDLQCSYVAIFEYESSVLCASNPEEDTDQQTCSPITHTQVDIERWIVESNDQYHIVLKFEKPIF